MTNELHDTRPRSSYADRRKSETWGELEATLRRDDVTTRLVRGLAITAALVALVTASGWAWYAAFSPASPTKGPTQGPTTGTVPTIAESSPDPPPALVGTDRIAIVQGPEHRARIEELTDEELLAELKTLGREHSFARLGNVARVVIDGRAEAAPPPAPR